MAEIYQLPDGNSGSGVGNIPFSIPIGGGNGLFGNGSGQTNLMDLLGFAIVASIFPNMFGGYNNGFGGGWGGGNGAAGFLSNQINNDTGRELIMQAVTNQGEASRTAIQTLSTMLGQDFNLVNSAVGNVQNALQSLALQQAVSVPNIINAIQSGDAAMTSAFQKCCCDQKLLTVEQGYQAQLRTLEQTTALSGQADRNTAAITAAIANQTTMINDKFCDLEKREMQAKIDTQSDIIGQLRGQIDNAQQTAAITGYVNSVVAPLSTKLAEIASKQPNTVPVQWPQLQAINTTPYVSGGIYGAYGYGYGNNGLVF